ncbi:MAG: PqqD family protein [Sedimenticola sp.]
MDKPASLTALYTRNPTVAFRSMEGSGFLADQDNEAVYYLNETGAAIWHFLQQPATLMEIAETMQTAFPDTPYQQIEQDVSNTLLQLAEKGLVVISE